MVVLAVLLFIVGVILFGAGFVLFANGTGVAPQRRTKDDPTGVKRAASRTPWRDVFRQVPKSFRLVKGHEATHEERLAVAGALLLLTGVMALCVAILSVIAAFI